MISRLLAFPLTRLIFYAVGLSVLMILLVQIQLRVLHQTKLGQLWWMNLIGAALFLAGYWLLVRVFERRQVTELGIHGMLAELGAGISVEGLLLAAIIAILAICGVYTVNSVGVPPDFALSTSFFIFGAVNEEISYRAVIFRFLEEWLGSWTALIITAGVFGASHLLNPNATYVGAIGIALSGLLDSGLFMITRRLWIVIGGHFAWNMAEGPIFGASVSGFEFKSVLTPRIIGPDWLTGGAFGPEASVVAMILCLIVGGAVVMVAYRRNQFVGPRWRRPASSLFPYMTVKQ